MNIDDTGSFQKNEGSYYGLAKDVDKLPKEKGMLNGTMAYCVDTGDVYMWCGADRRWHLQ